MIHSIHSLHNNCGNDSLPSSLRCIENNDASKYILVATDIKYCLHGYDSGVLYRAAINGTHIINSIANWFANIQER